MMVVMVDDGDACNDSDNDDIADIDIELTIPT